MTAKEMFEELGYKLCRSKDGTQLTYAKNSGIITYVVAFNKTCKGIVVFKQLNSNPEEIKGDLIEIEVFRAIQKQVDELGW